MEGINQNMINHEGQIWDNILLAYIDQFVGLVYSFQSLQF